MNWKVGDIAIVCGVNYPENSYWIGTEVELLGEVENIYGHGWWVAPNDWFLDKNLKPLPPPNELTSWDDCICKPKELVRVEITQ